MRNIFFIAAGVFVAATVAGGGYYLLSHGLPAQNGAAVAAATAATSSPAAPRPVPARCGQSDGAVCVEYRNDKYHFSVFYSDQKEEHEFDEGGGASTITFENFNNGHGWQLFVVPYGEPQVTPARFKEDDPSGVRTDVQNVTVDGATGAAFYSYDARLGDTYEVWFIHGNYLYELTTLKPLAPQMQERLATWEWL